VEEKDLIEALVIDLKILETENLVVLVEDEEKDKFL